VFATTIPSDDVHDGEPHRAVRGGSWNDNARRARSAYRNANDPGNRNDNLGFRLALSSDGAAFDTVWIHDEKR